MIRSSKLSLQFANTGKREAVSSILSEYRRLVSCFVDAIWGLPKVPKLLPKQMTSSISTWLSARMLQCAAKQSSGIVRGTRQKQERRKFVYERLLAKGMFKKARKLKRIIDACTVSKPEIDNVEAELDSRFVTVDWNSPTSFDGVLVLSSVAKGFGKIRIPLKRTRHFNKISSRGVVKAGLRLSKTSATFAFEIASPSTAGNKTVGVDIGAKHTVSTSDGHQTESDIHGWTLSEILKKISRKKRGSKAFERASRHRKNFINWAINQVDLSNVKALKVERIKHLRLGVRVSKYLGSWTYRDIFEKLERYTEDAGVQILKVNPAFTSQRCSLCSWVQRANRRGSLFKCKSCGFEHDADLNASINIGLSLCPLGKDWRSLNNRTGFYWMEAGQESIVPATLGAG